jgi:hypothetical protein
MIYDSPSSGNFEVPAGVTELTIELWGAGGGASIVNTGVEVILCGGAGGEYFKKVISVTPGAFIPYVVGARGETAYVSGTIPFQGVDGFITTFGAEQAGAGGTATWVLGTPNSFAVGSCTALNNGGIDEDIIGSPGEIVITPISGGTVVPTHAFGGSTGKGPGRAVTSNSTDLTTVATGGSGNVHYGAGGTASVSSVGGSPQFIGGYGVAGGIVLRWRE